MKQTKNSRGELIIAGLGGMGVLSAGQVLLEAAFQQFKYVSYTPTYGFAKCQARRTLPVHYYLLRQRDHFSTGGAGTDSDVPR